jgi:hypothetical protein
MAIGINLGRDEDSPPSFEEYDGSILSHKYLMDSYEFGRNLSVKRYFPPIAKIGAAA